MASPQSGSWRNSSSSAISKLPSSSRISGASPASGEASRPLPAPLSTPLPAEERVSAGAARESTTPPSAATIALQVARAKKKGNRRPG
jgi:hypothetical protein